MIKKENFILKPRDKNEVEIYVIQRELPVNPQEISVYIHKDFWLHEELPDAIKEAVEEMFERHRKKKVISST
jgi:hypothetical protein